MELLEIRDKIDKIDDEVVSLLLRRLALAEQIGAVKRACALPVTDEAREQAVLSAVAQKSGTQAEAMKSIYEAIVAASRKVQQPADEA